MKSLVMCFYLGAVAVGNFLVAGVNHFIQIPDAAKEQLATAIAQLPPDWRNDPRTILLPGYDGVTGTADDFIKRLKDGVPTELEIPGQATFEQAAQRIEKMIQTNGGVLPSETEVSASIASLLDPWGAPIHYQTLNSNHARLISDGPDRKPGTRWDVGMTLTLPTPEEAKKASWADAFHPQETWLERRKRELGIANSATESNNQPTLIRSTFAGGQSRLHGAAYFHFFTWLMLGTAIAFIPYALLYRPKTWLQG